MNVEILTIGDELLIGQVVDTNAAWMGERLEEEGFRVVWHTTVGDVEADLLEAFDAALQRASIVLVTGGIGPTKDDITKKTLCKYFDSDLYFSDATYQNIEQIYCRTHRTMNELTRSQAMVPAKCTVIQNQAGTAPCTWFEQAGKVLVSMPGVPTEMKWLMTYEILPRLKKRFLQDVYIKHRSCWVSGFAESALAMRLADFEESLPAFVKLAYLPQPGLIRLRLSAYASSEEAATQAMGEQQQKLYAILGDHIMVEEDKAIEERIGEILKEKHLMMATAESCTGGRIASMITSVPGSSDYFAGGIVSYSNEVKHNVLGVSQNDLARCGAVSEPVVEQMALGAIRVVGCDCAVATSGIAGPGGGTPEKPVGTVWIAAAVKEKVVSARYVFGKVREQNIQRAANMALLMLVQLLTDGDANRK